MMVQDNGKEEEVKMGRLKRRELQNIEQGMSMDEVFRWGRLFDSGHFLGQKKCSIINDQCSMFKGERECRTDEQPSFAKATAGEGNVE
jgi:hypothetical protein